MLVNVEGNIVETNYISMISTVRNISNYSSIGCPTIEYEFDVVLNGGDKIKITECEIHNHYESNHRFGDIVKSRVIDNLEKKRNTIISYLSQDEIPTI